MHAVSLQEILAKQKKSMSQLFKWIPDVSV